MNQHKKHTSLQKPQGGKFHRSEWSFIGAPCPRIREIVTGLNRGLEDFSIAYLDDDHDVDQVKPLTFAGELQNQIQHWQFSFKSAHPDYQYRQWLIDFDAVLLNGNHYTAKRQVVIINTKKKESLSKKLDRLTSVSCCILDEGESDIYDFLKPLPSMVGVPIFSIQDQSAIINYFRKELESDVAELDGLVFAGGQSQRMGEDKALLQYHGKNQLNYSADLLSKFCSQVNISIANDSYDNSSYQLLKDDFVGLGPFGGLLTAFRREPNHAILSLPIDTPFIDHAVLQHLVSSRNPSKLATCFHNPQTNFPEPLITIWEPRAYQQLLYFLSLGYSCPRKVLINSDIEELHLEDSSKLFNANTPDDRIDAMSRLHS